MKARNFPKISPPQVALIIAERATGVVVSVNGIRILDDNSLYHVFDTLEDAENFVKTTELDSSFEFAVFGADGSLISVLERN